MQSAISKKEIKDQVIKVFEDEKWLIVVPKTFAASKLYGMNTKWCTTQKTYYNNYNRNGFLFYVIDKAINRKFGVPVNSNTNTTNLNIDSLEFYNNEDKGLRLSNLRDIYGPEVVKLLGEKMKGYYKETMLEKVKKRVLQDAIRTIGNVRTNVKRDGIFDNEDTNKLFNDLLVKMSEAIN